MPAVQPQPESLDVFVKPPGATIYVLFEELSTGMSVGKLRNLVAQHAEFECIGESNMVLRLVSVGKSKPAADSTTTELDDESLGLAEALEAAAKDGEGLGSGRAWLLAVDAPAADAGEGSRRGIREFCRHPRDMKSWL